MSSHEEAQDMVNYYTDNEATLYGKPLTFYLSQRLMVIEVTAAVLTLLHSLTASEPS